jgi:hypothetical protein
MGERTLANLTENREPRRKLDDVWERDFVDTCLEEGLWNFAFRSVALSFSPSVSPAPFGYVNGFDKPTDFIRTAAVTTDEFFKIPLLEYQEEVGFWFAQVDLLYVRYVSNDVEYGLDFSKWPRNFTRFSEHLLAYLTAPTIRGIEVDIKTIKEDLKEWRRKAKAVDAMEQPARFAPPSSWTRSRQQRRGDRGNRSQLIG